MNGYKTTEVSTAYQFTASMSSVWTMVHPLGEEIKIIESLTDNALDAVMHFHLTCVFGAWTADGVWYGYPDLTASLRSITTIALMPLGGKLSHHRKI
jgi:hypothetical protein